MMLPRRRPRLLLAGLTLFCISLMQAAVTGVVVDDAGQPVPRAALDYPGREHREVVLTNEQGQFRIERNVPKLLVRSPGYEVQLVTITEAKPLRVVLGRAAPRSLSFCRGVSECLTLGRSNRGLCLPRLPQIQVGEVEESPDSAQRIYTLTTAHGEAKLYHAAGMMWGGARIEPSKIWPLAEYHEAAFGRMLVNGSGKTSDGKYWRELTQSGEALWYQDLDAEAARIFDEMLDNACVNFSRRY